MSVLEQVGKILRSRKFWVLLAALVAVGSMYFGGRVDAWQALQAVIAALAVYSTGVAVEDINKKVQKHNPTPPGFTASPFGSAKSRANQKPIWRGENSSHHPLQIRGTLGRAGRGGL